MDISQYTPIQYNNMNTKIKTGLFGTLIVVVIFPVYVMDKASAQNTETKYSKNYIKMYQNSVRVPIDDWKEDRLKNMSSNNRQRQESTTNSKVGRKISGWDWVTFYFY